MSAALCLLAAVAAAAGDDLGRFAVLWRRAGEPPCLCGRCAWPTAYGERVAATRDAIAEDLERRGVTAWGVP